MFDKPTLIINLEGGVIQDMAVNCKLDVYVVDFDTDGVAPDDLTRFGVSAGEAVVSGWSFDSSELAGWEGGDCWQAVEAYLASKDEERADEDGEAAVPKLEGGDIEAQTNLSSAAKRRYVETGGIRCPHCLGDDIEADRMQTDDFIAWCLVTCTACGAQWRDQYDLVGVEGVEGPTRTVSRPRTL